MCLLFNANAQSHPHIMNMPKFERKHYHFGYSISLSKMDFSVKPAENFANFDSLMTIQSDPQFGFKVGIIGDLHFGGSFDLRFIPGVSLGQRNIDYTLQTRNSQLLEKKYSESAFVDLPLLVKYRSKRLCNTAAYILSGADFTIDMASLFNTKSTNNDALLKLKKFNVAYELGTGFDFYTYSSKISIELKMSYGFKDLLKRENNTFTNSINKLYSKIFYLSVTIEG
jgi:hypothetical protein